MEGKQGYKHTLRAFMVTGFPVAKLDAKGEFIACAETSDRMLAGLLDAIRDGKRGATLKSYGFADERPFKGPDGKILPDSAGLNKQCAQLRAEAVAAYLKEATGRDVEAQGFGPTDQFGPVDVNRRVVVEVDLSTIQTAQAPAQPPAGQQPSQAPQTPAGPPVQVPKTKTQ